MACNLHISDTCRIESTLNNLVSHGKEGMYSVGLPYVTIIRNFLCVLYNLRELM